MERLTHQVDHIISGALMQNRSSASTGRSFSRKEGGLSIAGSTNIPPFLSLPARPLNVAAMLAIAVPRPSPCPGHRHAVRRAPAIAVPRPSPCPGHRRAPARAVPCAVPRPAPCPGHRHAVRRAPARACRCARRVPCRASARCVGECRTAMASIAATSNGDGWPAPGLLVGEHR
jgi:hypothetical protein